MHLVKTWSQVESQQSDDHGAQLWCTTFLSITFSLLGLMIPSHRGRLIMGELIFFVLMGNANGYITTQRLIFRTHLCLFNQRICCIRKFVIFGHNEIGQEMHHFVQMEIYWFTFDV
jgi:Endomembrane protein 70